MAVLRNSDPLNLQGQQVPQLAQSGAGAARPDVNKHLQDSPTWENIQTTDVITDHNRRAQVSPTVGIVSALFGQAAQVTQQAFNAELEDTYLRGVAAAETGQAMADIEANPLTRAWATAGYRDTSVRLALAQSEAQLAQDMKDLRERSPAEFNLVLQQRRQALMPQIEGMSRKQRESMFGQLLTSDRAAIAAHAEEHSKFIIDQRFRSVSIGLNTRIQKMNAAKGNPASYGGEVDAYLANLFSNSLNDDTLPIEVRENWAAQGLQYAIASDNLSAYDKAASDIVQFPDGTEGTMLSRLPLDVQMSLGKQYRAALSGGNMQAQVQWQADMGRTLAAMKDETKPLPSPDEFMATVAQGVQIGAIKDDTVRSLSDSYWTAYGKKSASAGLAQALTAGNVDYVYSKGYTIKEAVDAVDEQMQVKGMSMPDRLGALMDMGLTHNYPEAYKKAGEMAAVALRNVGLKDELTEPEVNMVRNISSRVADLKTSADEAGYQNFLAGMSDEDATFVSQYVTNLQKAEGDAGQAAKVTREIMVKNEAATAAQRAARSQGRAEAYQQKLDSLAPKTFLGWANQITSFSGTARAEDTIRPGVTWGVWREDETAVNEQMASMKHHLLDAMVAYGTANPYSSTDDIYAMAAADVARRTIETGDGRMYLPSAVGLTDFFQAPPNANAEDVGRELSKFGDEHLKPDGDELIVWSTSVAGGNTLTWRRYGPRGEEASGSIDARDIGAALYQRDREKAPRIRELEGPGRTVTRDTGEVTFNGLSTTAVDPETMFQFRERLVDHEGVVDTAYKDGKGVAVGVGINQTSGLLPTDIKEGDKVDKPTISRTFARASDEAAKRALSTMQAVNLAGKDTFLLLAEMSYQSGHLLLDRRTAERDMLVGMGAGDEAVALAALRKTDAYKFSGEARRQAYENQLIKAMRGK